MRKHFIVTLLLFFLLWGGTAFSQPSHFASTQKEVQIQQIDQQIEELEDMKRGYEAKALRHEDQADRLQFDDQMYLETRRHIQLADENRSKAAAIQKEIDRLRAQRVKITGSSKK